MKKKELVLVDIGRLSQGLNTTFRGVAEIFEAIGAEEKPGLGVVKEAAAVGKEAVKDEAVDSKAADKEGAAGSDDGGSTGGGDTAEAESITGAVADASSEYTAETTKENAGADAEAATEAPTQTTSLTVDDLMKVAAAKIKMKPKNSDKIGALVKAYGKKTLKDIPAEKMESFMTDLSQI